jgi:hypothetical protein
MANFVFNVAKGRVAEYFNRVDSEDPATSRIVVIPFKESGTEANGQDADTLTAVEAATGFSEQTEGWSRKTVTGAELAAVAADDTENRMEISLPAVLWTAPTAGKNTTGLVVCYDPKTGEGTDEEIVPLVHLDFAVTADGNDVELKAGEIYRAS